MAEPIVDVLEETWRSIGELCAGLDEAVWERSTDCPGWSVRDQVAHMIGTERMLLGEQPPTAEGSWPDHVRNPIGEFNEQWVAARRDRPGHEVLDEFREVTGRRLGELRALPAEKWDEVGFTPEGQGPYREFMRIRAFDCWVHEQDIRRAVGVPGGLSGAPAEHAVGRIDRAMPYVVGKKAGAPDGATVVFDVTGGVPHSLAIVVRDGRAVVAEEMPEAPTVRLSTDTETYAALACGRWDGTRGLEDGRVRIDGDAELGRTVVENMAFTI